MQLNIAKIYISRLLLFLIIINLSACESVIRGKEYILPGERENILIGSANIKLAESFDTIQLSEPLVTNRWISSDRETTNNKNNIAFSEEFIKKWSVNIGQGSSKLNLSSVSPIYIGDALFVVDTENTISSVNPDNGAINWSKSLFPEGEDPKIGFGGGLFANSGIIFFTNGFGELYALDPYNGDILWRDMVSSPVRAAPIADNSMVFVLSVDNKINAFDIQSGSKKWEYSWFSDTAGLVQTSNMALFEDKIIVPYKSGEIFVFKKNNGNRLWADSVNRKNIKNSLSQIKDITASPVIHGNLLLTVGFQGRLIANNVNNGFRVWELPISSSITPVASNNYLFIVSNDNILFAIDAESGDVLWTHDINSNYEFKNDNKIISMQILQNRLYLFLSSGDLIVHDPKTGKLTDILKNKIEGSTIPPIIVNKNLYVISNDGELISYR